MKKLIIFLLAAILLLSFSCKKKPIGPVSEEPTFTINGLVVKDINDPPKDIAYFKIWRNDTLYNNATVKVGNRNIPNIGSGEYFAEFSDTTFKMNSVYIDSIISPQDTVTITFSFTMPDTFSAEIQSDKDTFTTADFPITINWTASSNANGYILGVAKGDTISGAVLYSGTVNSPPEQIPQDAFYTDGIPILVEGDYWIYIVAYNKSFVSYSDDSDVPFELPAGLPSNNITGAKGTIGAGVIAKKATITMKTLSQ
jgi:hypothetical protein